jgi:hypothetical protein
MGTKLLSGFFVIFSGMGMLTPAISSSRRWHPTFASTSRQRRHNHAHCGVVKLRKFFDID